MYNVHDKKQFFRPPAQSILNYFICQVVYIKETPDFSGVSVLRLR